MADMFWGIFFILLIVAVLVIYAPYFSMIALGCAVAAGIIAFISSKW